MRYHFSISHVPGKDLITADALSHAPISPSSPSDVTLLAEVTSMVAAITNSLPPWTNDWLKFTLIKQKMTPATELSPTAKAVGLTNSAYQIHSRPTGLKGVS